MLTGRAGDACGTSLLTSRRRRLTGRRRWDEPPYTGRRRRRLRDEPPYGTSLLRGGTRTQTRTSLQYACTVSSLPCFCDTWHGRASLRTNLLYGPLMLTGRAGDACGTSLLTSRRRRLTGRRRWDEPPYGPEAGALTGRASLRDEPLARRHSWTSLLTNESSLRAGGAYGTPRALMLTGRAGDPYGTSLLTRRRRRLMGGA